MQNRNKDGKFGVALPWWRDPNIKICYFDIETTGFKGDNNFIICWAVLGDEDTKPVVDFATPEELGDWRKRDKRIVTTLKDTLSAYDAIVTYNGIMFDAKMFKTRLVYWDRKPFLWKEKLHIDLYWKAKTLFNLSRTSLANVTKLFGIEGKTPLEFEYWSRAAYGDPAAMRKLLVHNRGDVIILRDLFWAMEPYCKFEKKPF